MLTILLPCRLSAIYGGTYMLDKPDCQIEYDSEGKAIGVRDKEGALAKCDAVVCDPSYAPEKCKTVGKVRVFALAGLEILLESAVL